MEYFCGWIQKIAYYMILVTLVMQVAAGESYRKYIRLFTGIILILLILSPVIHLLGLDGERYIQSAESEYEAAAERIEGKIQELEEEVASASGEKILPGDRAGQGLEENTEENEENEEMGRLEGAGKIEVGEIRIGR